MFGFSENAEGVRGLSTTGTAVHGENTGTGEGVTGTTGGAAAAAVHGFHTSSGIGVLGESIAGTGVLASAVTALDVVGSAAFSRSGVLTERTGHSSATKTGAALTSASLVLATLQQNRAGVFVQAAVPDVCHKSFTVHLSKTVPASTKAAWFIAN